MRAVFKFEGEPDTELVLCDQKISDGQDTWDFSEVFLIESCCSKPIRNPVLNFQIHAVRGFYPAQVLGEMMDKGL